MTGGDHPGRVFISYSRTDGADFAHELRTNLEKENLSFWQDLTALEGGQDWWTQIEYALRSRELQHFILVVTPSALESGVVRQEIGLARQEGKSVSPVRGPGVLDLNKLPRWLGHVHNLEIPEQKTALIAKLKKEAEQRRVAMMAPELPADFVSRPKEFDALKERLLDPQGDSIAGITAALKGAGGYGKTTLAKALARDPDIRDAYFDGILWAELGEKPERLIATLSDLVTLLSGERPQLETINAAAAKLGETLSDRRILMVIDDVWREQDLRPFLQGGRNCVRLVTTRIDSVLPAEALRQKVDVMEGSEALSLLSCGLDHDQATRERASLQALAARLGEWPLLLKFVNGFLRNRVSDGEPLPVAIVGANRRLDAKGLTVFDAREEALARTISVNLELMSASEWDRFGELDVFPTGDIPISVVAKLWAVTGELDDIDTDALIARLFDLSLLNERDLNQRFVRLHDTVRRLARNRAGKERLVALHELLAAILGTRSESSDEPTRRYLYRNLPHHLAEAGERGKLDSLLLDPAWLKAKLDATRNPLGLFLDYQQHGVGEAQSLIGRTLRLILGIVARDRRQLPVQLATRLARIEAADVREFAAKARALFRRPLIVPLEPTLTPPGAETARLEGHTDAVQALCLTSDGRLASGSDDNTIRLWDVATGAEVARLEGHTNWVSALCFMPDGRLASGSRDSTIRLWDIATRAEVARLEGHADWVSALCLMPDGRLASGSRDSTIRLWDIATRAETARFNGHTDRVSALCPMSDGRLASGSWDATIRVWDVAADAEIARLEGHTGGISALCLLPDQRLASGAVDNAIRVWDVATGAETARLEGYAIGIAALCPLPDGRLASGSWDNMIRLWDVETGAATARLDGSAASVFALLVMPDGRLALGSVDSTIRLRDVATGAEIARLEGHEGSVLALWLLPDGRLASGSADSTIRLWNVEDCAETARLEGHTGVVAALCLLPDGRLASGSWDNTIRLWDLTTGSEGARLEGHTNWVSVLCTMPDGSLASGSRDNTIRLWDVATRTETTRLEGHTGHVAAVCLLPDGRLASGSEDKTIRLWNTSTGAETARLEGHLGEVSSLCPLPDGRLASSSLDSTIRLWNVATGAETARLELDGPVRAIAAPWPNIIVAGDDLGRLHWLEVRD